MLCLYFISIYGGTDWVWGGPKQPGSLLMPWDDFINSHNVLNHC